MYVSEWIYIHTHTHTHTHLLPDVGIHHVDICLIDTVSLLRGVGGKVNGDLCVCVCVCVCVFSEEERNEDEETAGEINVVG